MDRHDKNLRAILDALPLVDAITDRTNVRVAPPFVTSCLRPGTVSFVFTHRTATNGFLGAIADLVGGEMSPADIFAIRRDPHDRKGEPTWEVAQLHPPPGVDAAKFFVTSPSLVEAKDLRKRAN